MPWVPCVHFDLGVDRLAWSSPGSKSSPLLHVLKIPAGDEAAYGTRDADPAIEALSEWSARKAEQTGGRDSTDPAWRGCVANVSIAREYVRMFDVPAMNSGCRNLDEVRALCAARFEQLFAVSTDEWQIDADWRADRWFVACAAPRRLCQAIQEALRDTGAHVRIIAPRVSFHLRRWLRRSSRPVAWLIAVDDAYAQCFIASEQGYRVLEGEVRPALWSDEHALDTWLNAQSLRAGAPRPSTLLVVDANAVLQHMGRSHPNSRSGREGVVAGVRVVIDDSVAELASCDDRSIPASTSGEVLE
jgi:hypothetical protein